MSPQSRISVIVAILLSVPFFAKVTMAEEASKSPPSVDQAVVDKTSTGYLMATAPRQWSFPRDHGRHDGFKTEWWYFAGNVSDNAGRKFGYQLTFFRVAISPRYVDGISPWLIGDQYFAHAAVSDLAGGTSHEGEFHFKDQMDHGAPGIAASAPDTLDVTLHDWSAKLLPAQDVISLDANDSAFGIHLTCDPRSVPVLQGPGGVNRKGRERGQASYYYSMPRLLTSGAITVNGQTFHVTGQTWMDHEFSSNALGANQVGWDWVGLTLADGKSLMVYRLRNKTGGSDFLSGTLIDAVGHPKYLTDQEITFTASCAPGTVWKSDSGGSYPQMWSLSVAGLPPLTVRSRMPGQELRTSATTRIDYFEGSCDVTTTSGQRIGEGYLEMTGYAKPISPF